MATSILRKFITNQSRYVASSRKITSSHLTTTTTSATTSTTTTATTTTTTHNPFSSTHPFQIHTLDKPILQNSVFLDPSKSFGIYPSFSFEHFLNPVVPYAPEFGVDLGKEDEGSNMIWADSVKKKRKKKMNKHKLKKLRKRLRRKT